MGAKRRKKWFVTCPACRRPGEVRKFAGAEKAFTCWKCGQLIRARAPAARKLMKAPGFIGKQRGITLGELQARQDAARLAQIRRECMSWSPGQLSDPGTREGLWRLQHPAAS